MQLPDDDATLEIVHHSDRVPNLMPPTKPALAQGLPTAPLDPTLAAQVEQMRARAEAIRAEWAKDRSRTSDDDDEAANADLFGESDTDESRRDA